MQTAKWLIIGSGVLACCAALSRPVAGKEAARFRRVAQDPTAVANPYDTAPSTSSDPGRPGSPRVPDRSPILRSFNPSLKQVDPYSLPMTAIRRAALKW